VEGIPVTIGDKTYRLRWNMKAMLVMELKFGAKFDKKSAEERKKKFESSTAELFLFTMQMAWAMTQYLEPAPRLSEVECVTQQEFPALLNAVQQAMTLGREGPLGEAPAVPAKPAAKSARPGIGVRHSSRR
jgi:hypothetical protein